MNLDDYVEQTRAAGFEWAADEMQLFIEHPELLESGDQVPEFDRFQDERSLPMIHFYLGVVFGVGFERNAQTN